MLIEQMMRVVFLYEQHHLPLHRPWYPHSPLAISFRLLPRHYTISPSSLSFVFLCIDLESRDRSYRIFNTVLASFRRNTPHAYPACDCFLIWVVFSFLWFWADKFSVCFSLSCVDCSSDLSENALSTNNDDVVFKFNDAPCLRLWIWAVGGN